MINLSVETKDIKNTIMNFIVPLVALLLSAALIFLIIVPQVNAWPHLQDDFNAAKTLEASLNTKKQVLDKLIDFQSVVDENGRLFSQALASEPSVPELLTQVDTIARESGLEVSRLSYSITDIGAGADAEDSPINYKAVILNLGTSGNFDQMAAFLTNLENSARLIEVITYRYSGESLPETNTYAGTFVLRAPYLKVESVAVTDAPVTIDISSPDFLNILSRVKSLKFYDIQVDKKYLNVKESKPEAVSNLEGVKETSLENKPVTETQ